MRPGRTQTGMSSYWSPYIFFMRLHGTGLKMNSDRPDFVSVADPTRVTFVPVGDYRSHVKRKRISDQVHK